MKNVAIILYLMVGFILFSCNKKEIIFDQNPSTVHKKTLIFSGLTAVNNFIAPLDSTTIKAEVSGDELVYTWKVSRGIISGNGYEIKFSDTITGVDTVTCEVKDKYGKVSSKNVIINVTNDFVFSRLSASDTLLPLNLTDTLTAIATGEEITYTWTATRGTIMGSGNKVTFSPSGYGDCNIKCVVTNKDNNTITKNLTLTVTNQIIFKSLVASPDIIAPNELTLISALAYGNNLSYTWSKDVSLVTLSGSGSSIHATLCHSQTFVVTCKIIDNAGSEKTKSVTIKMHQ
jgi:hypothetical protein